VNDYLAVKSVIALCSDSTVSEKTQRGYLQPIKKLVSIIEI